MQTRCLKTYIPDKKIEINKFLLMKDVFIQIKTVASFEELKMVRKGCQPINAEILMLIYHIFCKKCFGFSCNT